MNILFSQIIDALPIGSCIVDYELRVIDWNELLASWTGVSREEALDKDILTLAPSLNTESIRKRIKLVQQGGPPVVFSSQLHDSLFPCSSKTGERIVHEVTVSSFRLVDGSPPYLLFSLQDVTYHTNRLEKARKIKNELYIAKQNAEEASRTRGRFVANMSHELRTPMNGILGMTHLLSETQLIQEQQEYVDAILSCGNNLLSVLNDVLDLSKVEAGMLIVRPRAFSLSDFIAHISELVTVLAKEQGVEFNCEVCESALRTSYVVGDAERLQQILMNLLGNAIKFTSDGGAVYLKVSTKESDGVDLFTFEVADTGIGIDAEDQQRIFDSFYRAVDGLTDSYQGTGLGLNISSRLASLMSGQIMFSSELGVGSTFCLQIPLEMANEDNAPVEERVSRSEEGRSLRVLVAEDNVVNRKLCVKLLEKSSHTVLAVENGKEALEAFTKEDFDLIIMDIQMPVMDGIEAVSRIRASGEKGQNVPIVALTAHVLNEYRDQCMKVGMNDYVSKPMNIKELREVVRRYSHNS